MKTLSVIVPSYNMEEYLPKCLGSLIVAPELMDRLEVLVINDGSKDRTGEIAHGFAEKWPRTFRVVDKENGNYGSCVNRGLVEATGRFVKILDADDTYDTVAFGTFLRRLEEVADGIDAILTDYETVDADGKTLAASDLPFGDGETFTCGEVAARRVPLAMHALAYRTQRLRQVGYRQTEGISYTDIEWFYLPMAAARRGLRLKLKIYRYLIGRAGQTMERTTHIRNRGMLERIFGNMLAIYDKADRTEVSVVSLEYVLQRIFGHILAGTALDVPGGGDRAFWERLAEFVRRYPFLEAGLAEQGLFTNTPFRFCYARFCLRHPALRPAVLRFVQWYHRLRVGN